MSSTLPCNLPEKTTTPYYVLLAVRVVLQHRLDPEPLSQFLSGCAALGQLQGHSQQILSVCAQVLSEAVMGAPTPFVPGASEFKHGIRHQILRRRAHPAGGAEDADPQQARALRDWIDARWHQVCHLSDYAEQAGVPARVLGKRFAQAYGVSPKQYQQNRRLDQAAHLLVETAWDLTAIAQEAGFYDSAHLSRTFKRRHGVSPRNFRKRWHQE